MKCSSSEQYQFAEFIFLNALKFPLARALRRKQGHWNKDWQCIQEQMCANEMGLSGEDAEER